MLSVTRGQCHLYAYLSDDRVVFGSNWPVSLRFAGYETVLGIVRPYVESRGAAASAAYFSGNAKRVYRVRS